MTRQRLGHRLLNKTLITVKHQTDCVKESVEHVIMGCRRYEGGHER